MTNVKISQKGRALLKKKVVAKMVAMALVYEDGRLSNTGTVSVSVGGKTITVRF